MALTLSSTLRGAYRAERATRRPRPPRTPLLVHAGRAAAKLANHAAKTRQAVLALGGFSALDYAAFQYDQIAGWAAVGVTLLLLEWLTSGGGDQ